MPDDTRGGKVPEGKIIDHTKSKVRKDADGNITAVKLVFTDGTSVVVTRDDISSSDKTFDFGTTAENQAVPLKKWENISEEWSEYEMSEEGQDALSVEEFTWKHPTTNEVLPLNMQDIRKAVDKERLGKALEPNERAMLNAYKKQALAISDAKERKVKRQYDRTQIMMKVSKLRKQVGEIFKFTSDEQEKMCSATWFCGDGATILSGIPGVGKSQYILVAMMLFCNGLNRNEINQARRQNYRFNTLIKHYKDAIETRKNRLKEQNITEEVRKNLVAELDGLQSAYRTLKARHDEFMREVRSKMERHTAIVRLDPEKTPEEIFYWTRVGLKEVDPTASVREQAYNFTPMPRDIVLKPIKFFNEANRMNSATQDAVLGLMAEHEIEYLGKLFPSPNGDSVFCNKELKESWMWTEDILGTEIHPEQVAFDSNLDVRCPHHKVDKFPLYPVKKIVNGKEVWETETRDVEDVSKELPDVRMKLLTNPEFLKKLPKMDFVEGEWHCKSAESPMEEVKDEATGLVKSWPTHRSKTGTVEDKTFLEKPPLSYVLTPEEGKPWMTTYPDKVKGQIVWFDTNPHVRNRLDLATIDRLDASVIFPALKLGGKADLLRLKFPHKAEPVGESLVKIAFRRILTLPTELEAEPSIDPMTYEELLAAWTLVREEVDPSSMLSAITLITEVFSVSATRLRARDNAGNAEIYGTQLGRNYPVYNPVVRDAAATGAGATAMLGEAAAKTAWGAFTDMSVFEAPERAGGGFQTVVKAGDMADESGVRKQFWPTWELQRTFGTRSAESITKLAKSIAFLEACDRIKGGERWPGVQLEMNHVTTVVPYVYSHRIWVESGESRGVVTDGKMMKLYPNVETFIKQEIINHWLLAIPGERGITKPRIEDYIELFNSAMSWSGRMGIPPNWVIPPSPDTIANLSPANDMATLSDPLRNAIYDYAVYRFKEESRPLFEYYQNKIKMLKENNYTRTEVVALATEIEAATTHLTNLTMEPGTGIMTARRPGIPTEIGGDKGVLLAEINETLWNQVISFEASSSTPRVVIPFLLYMYDVETTVAGTRGRTEHPGLPGLTADQKKKIESAIRGVDASGNPIATDQKPLFTFTYNNSGDKFTIIVETSDMKSLNPNKMVGGVYVPVPTNIKVTLASENRDQAIKHKTMWEAIVAVVADPDAHTRVGKEMAEYILSEKGADFVKRIKELIP